MGLLKDLLASGALEKQFKAQAAAAAAAAAPPPQPRVPLRALNANAAVDIKPRVVGNVGGLDLDGGGGGDSKRGTLPAKIEIGSLGSCSVGWPRRTRRAKQPTVIVRPSVYPEEPPDRPVRPCNALGELKPAIIGHLRDSRDVQSTIGDVLKSGTLVRKRRFFDGKENDGGDGKNSLAACKHLKTERAEMLSLRDMAKEELMGRLESCGRIDSEMANSVEELSFESLDGFRSRVESWELTTGDRDDDLDDQSINFALQNQNGPAAIWMKLVNQDIKGRLSALKRSRRRVRTAIVAKDDIFMPPDQSGLLDLQNHDDPEKVKRQYELQMDKWKALFLSMDNALGVEASRLENHWKYLQEMHCSCNINKGD